jgi:GNAT superfamily N-acetyltransferase
MSAVRPLAPGDLDQVASLFSATFLNRHAAAGDVVKARLRETYLDDPFNDPDIPALVHVADDGRINGFVGVHVVPYRVDGRPVRAAFCGALMSESEGRDPMVGARLLKAYLAGAQDISISETANVVSQNLWERLHGKVLAGHSLDWLRVLRPAGFALAMASRKLAPLKVFAPLARLADERIAKRRKAASFTGVTGEAPAGPLVREDVNLEDFAALVRRFSDGLAARPDWENGYIEHVLAVGLDKPAFGAPVMMAVRTRSGEPVGGFLYHARPGGIGRVLQVLYAPGRAGIVLDHLFADAHARGVAALRGRSQPEIVEASTRRSMLFLTVSASVVLAKDAALAAPFLNGGCMLNGLAGESWNRFFGGEA